jgi:hypothetical protein
VGQGGLGGMGSGCQCPSSTPILVTSGHPIRRTDAPRFNPAKTRRTGARVPVLDRNARARCAKRGAFLRNTSARCQQPDARVRGHIEVPERGSSLHDAPSLAARSQGTAKGVRGGRRGQGWDKGDWVGWGVAANALVTVQYYHVHGKHIRTDYPHT